MCGQGNRPRGVSYLFYSRFGGGGGKVIGCHGGWVDSGVIITQLLSCRCFLKHLFPSSGMPGQEKPSWPGTERETLHFCPNGNMGPTKNCLSWDPCYWEKIGRTQGPARLKVDR